MLRVALCVTEKTGSNQDAHQAVCSFLNYAREPRKYHAALKKEISVYIGMWERLPNILHGGRKVQVADQSENILQATQTYLPVSAFSPGNTHVLQYHRGTTPSANSGELSEMGERTRTGKGQRDFISPTVFFFPRRMCIYGLLYH